MAWTIEFEREAERELTRLGTVAAERILTTLQTRIAARDDPHELGTALVGRWSGLWRYRIGDYRVVARIEGERLVILVVRVAHRREVYR